MHQNKTVFYSLSALFSAILISTALSKDIENSFSQFYKYAACLSAFLAVRNLSLSRQKILILCLIANAAIVSMCAIQWFLRGTFRAMDYLAYHNIHWDFAVEFLSRGRAFMPFTLPADLAGYSIIFIPPAITLLLEKENETSCRILGLSVKNLFFIMAASSGLLVMLSTQSLGATASLLASATIFYVIQKRQNRKNLRIGIVASFFTLGLILIMLFRSNNPHEFNQPLFSFNQRLSYWKHAVSLIHQHPFAGIGLGNYPFFKGWWAHNAYLQLWTEAGLLGIIGLLGIATATIRINPCNFPAHEQKFFSGLWIGNLAFLIHNLVDTTFFHPEISLQWWVIAAILVTAHNQIQRPEPQPKNL
ncbi:MAG: O-antigen ligase family protein [Candidatus Omnitrophica bacterium]|nr:O-antigen ligase family protein [Candidatus Omnitrophota bacterium]